MARYRETEAIARAGRRAVGIPGFAVMLAGLGVYAIYAGVEDVPFFDGLRQLLRGERPVGPERGPSFLSRFTSPEGTVEGDPAVFPSGQGSGQIVQIPGTGIRVDRSIAPGVTTLITKARAEGHRLDGWGHRTHEQQIQLRRQHCGTSHYDVYEKPSGQCRPPTARPGHSMHERGLAIDFTWGGRQVSRGSFGFGWLRINAPLAGLRNLPSEPWHWSTTGT